MILYYLIKRLKILKMILKIFIILKIALSISCCNFEKDVDFFGKDLYFSYSLNVGECCNRCNQESDCKAWTFVSQSLVCWIKSDVGQRRLNSTSSKLIFF